MIQIEIDFDVFKELTARREKESITYNDVIRNLLNFKPINQQSNSLIEEGSWTTKGVTFPPGTEFRATYKGKTYFGKVENGVLNVDGKSYDSPSAAACEVTGHSANGWTFWVCRFPGQTRWQIIKALRK